MKKIFILLLFIFSICLTSCSLDKEAYLVRAGGPSFNYGSKYIINSIEEFNEYVSETYNNYDTAVEKYDEEYFITSALVIAEIIKNTGNAKLTIKSVNFDDDTIIIKFKTKTSNIVTCDMAYWHILVECSQEEASSIVNVKDYNSGNLVEDRV